MKTAAGQIFKARLVVRLLTIVSLTVLSNGQAAAQGVVRISSCPFVIVAPGNYLVDQDLFCPGNGITIQSSDVKLNVSGHTINGLSSQLGIGILVRSVTNVEVRNGTVTNFSIGISLESTTDSRIDAMTSTGNLAPGLQLVFSSDNTITGSDISDNRGSGVLLISSNGNVFRGNRVLGNSLAGYAITPSSFFTSNNNLITSSRVSSSIIEGNQTFGVVITAGGNNNNTVESSHVLGNVANGIYVLGGANNTVRSNTVNQNGRGIVFNLGATASIIVSNTARDNAIFDLQDDNPNCDANVWRNNNFITTNQPQCID